MRGKRVPVRVLAARTIPNVSTALAAALGLQLGQCALGLLATDCDDATYIALDEATKAAAVEVVYAKSLYAGAANAVTALSGEVIGILAGPDPASVTAGLQAATALLQGLGFRRAGGDVVYLAHCVARAGRYLSKLAKTREGQAVAYLIAPPLPAILGLDAALKAADVELTAFYPPPSETNFAGGLLTGSQDACRAACDAFAAAVEDAAANPNQPGG